MYGGSQSQQHHYIHSASGMDWATNSPILSSPAPLMQPCQGGLSWGGGCNDALGEGSRTRFYFPYSLMPCSLAGTSPRRRSGQANCYQTWKHLVHVTCTRRQTLLPPSGPLPSPCCALFHPTHHTVPALPILFCLPCQSNLSQQCFPELPPRVALLRHLSGCSSSMWLYILPELFFMTAIKQIPLLEH